MSTCRFFGHEWQRMPGAGQYKDQEFLVCQRCGRTIPLDQDASEDELQVSVDGAMTNAAGQLGRRHA
jgi:hypothetical protein